jgi:acetoin utilization deacetylase AcuC-like enzyme
MHATDAKPMSSRTAYITDELCFWHDPGNYALMLKPGGFVEPYNRHIENADPKRRLHQLLQVSGLMSQLHVVTARDAQVHELTRLHSADYVAKVQTLATQGGGDTGIGAPISSNGWDAARRSAGCALTAVDTVMQGQATTAYALTRPPGHHAEPTQGMGFCVFANAALAAAHAIEAHGLERVAIVDWDVHFGNGTQKCFENRSDVLTISVHQHAGYLFVKGESDELGEGAGTGYNLNIALPPGCGFGAYRESFEKVILPALDAYQPQLIIVACGYDAGRFDPLGRMLLDGVAFRWMTDALLDMATKHAQGRVVMTHEGGYCPVSVPFWGLSVLEQMRGVRTEVACPFTHQHDQIPAQRLQSEQARLVQSLANHFDDVRQRHWV